MKNRRLLVWAVFVVLIALVAWKLKTSHFDWAGFWHACHNADWRLLLVATLVIWSNCIFRALRWNIFLKPALSMEKRVSWVKLLPSQFVGFAGLAIFGRIGELIRPYLVARRTGLSLASQIAVVAIERIFDLGAFAIIFSTNLLLAKGLETLPYHEKFHTIGYALTALTAIIVLFVIAVRIAGGVVASAMGRFVALISKPAGEAVRDRILAFRDGLNTLETTGDLVTVSILSLLLWGSIALAYVLVMRAFPAPVANLSVSHVLLLMGFSVVGSVVQLPGVGGGAQALSIGALTMLFGIPPALAGAAGLVLWVVTTMTIIPVGLAVAKFENISLSSITRESEAAGQVLEGENA